MAFTFVGVALMDTAHMIFMQFDDVIRTVICYICVCVALRCLTLSHRSPRLFVSASVA